jgi:hypothetical protein
MILRQKRMSSLIPLFQAASLIWLEAVGMMMLMMILPLVAK